MWESWIQTYGYLAVFVGGIFEGETMLILAGYAISRGYLDPLPTFVLAAAGGALGDATYFFLGRRFGPAAIRRFRFLRSLRARATLLLRRRGRTAAFLTRFMYGLRIILPLMMGAARFPVPLFLGYNALGALTFAAVYLTLGHLFGAAITRMLGRLRMPDLWILAALAALGAVIWALHEWRLYHNAPPIEEELSAPPDESDSRPAAD